MSDHELDRRFQDQNFKIDVTKQLAEVRVELKSNTAETQELQTDVKEFHQTFDRALYGSLLNKGLIGQASDNAREIKGLRSLILKGLPCILFVVFFFGEQINPIIKDWLYQKTHMKIFASVAETFKKEKSTAHETHYHIRHVTIDRPVDDPQ